MWILTTRGFYSVVEKPWDKDTRTLTVRGRSMTDLVNLASLFDNPGPITSDREADYLYRFQAPKLEVSQVFATLILGIGYDNFKDAVQAAQGAPRASVYGTVWGVLYDGLQGPRNLDETPLGRRPVAAEPDLDLGDDDEEPLYR